MSSKHYIYSSSYLPRHRRVHCPGHAINGEEDDNEKDDEDNPDEEDEESGDGFHLEEVLEDRGMETTGGAGGRHSAGNTETIVSTEAATAEG